MKIGECIDLEYHSKVVGVGFCCCTRTPSTELPERPQNQGYGNLDISESASKSMSLAKLVFDHVFLSDDFLYQFQQIEETLSCNVDLL